MGGKKKKNYYVMEVGWSDWWSDLNLQVLVLTTHSFWWNLGERSSTRNQIQKLPNWITWPISFVARCVTVWWRCSSRRSRRQRLSSRRRSRASLPLNVSGIFRNIGFLDNNNQAELKTKKLRTNKLENLILYKIL